MRIELGTNGAPVKNTAKKNAINKIINIEENMINRDAILTKDEEILLKKLADLRRRT